MNRFWKISLVMVFSGIIATVVHAGWDPNAVKKADDTIVAFKAADESLINFFNAAYGYAVFPSIGKGAVGIGGAHGSGILYEQGVPIGRTTMTQVTIGLQLGGQSYSEIIFFENKQTLDDFKDGFELAAQASAVAVDQGASADAAYNNGVAIFTLVQGGLMAEASIGGQKFSFEPK